MKSQPGRMGAKNHFVKGLKVFGLDPDSKLDRMQLKALTSWLSTWWGKPVLARFDRHCGCSCPCSPGFTLFFGLDEKPGERESFRRLYMEEKARWGRMGITGYDREPRSLHMKTLGDGAPSRKRLAENMQERMFQMGLADDAVAEK